MVGNFVAFLLTLTPPCPQHHIASFEGNSGLVPRSLPQEPRRTEADKICNILTCLEEAQRLGICVA